jgi:four helix bundle protein
MMPKSIGYEKAFKFSIRIVRLYQYLCKDKKEYVLSKQILRSGTSIGANIKEALQAQSKRDYLSKMNVALEEASETEYWLDLLQSTDYIDDKMYSSMIEDCRELIKILVSTVKTTRKSL